MVRLAARLGAALLYQLSCAGGFAYCAPILKYFNGLLAVMTWQDSITTLRSSSGIRGDDTLPTEANSRQRLASLQMRHSKWQVVLAIMFELIGLNASSTMKNSSALEPADSMRHSAVIGFNVVVKDSNSARGSLFPSYALSNDSPCRHACLPEFRSKRESPHMKH